MSQTYERHHRPDPEDVPVLDAATLRLRRPAAAAGEVVSAARLKFRRENASTAGRVKSALRLKAETLKPGKALVIGRDEAVARMLRDNLSTQVRDRRWSCRRLADGSFAVICLGYRDRRDAETPEPAGN